MNATTYTTDIATGTTTPCPPVVTPTQDRLWLVVRFRGLTTEVVGLFDSEDRAFEACKHGAYLTAPIDLNRTYTPEDPWRGVKAAK